MYVSGRIARALKFHFLFNKSILHIKLYVFVSRNYYMKPKIRILVACVPGFSIFVQYKHVKTIETTN